MSLPDAWKYLPPFFALLTACHSAKPMLVIPYLKSWDRNTMTLCCDRQAQDPECTSKHWTQAIRQHCKGRVSRVSQPDSPPSPCVTYTCGDEVRPLLDRVLSVEFVVDPSFKIYPNWRGNMETAIRYTNDLFRHTGIRFTEANLREAGLRARGDDADGYLAVLNQFMDPNVDIHVGVLGTEIQSGKPNMLNIGRSTFFGNKLVLMMKDSTSFKYTLPHEIGHIFGAVHTEDYSSFMYPREQGIPGLAGMDRVSLQAIRLAKHIDLRAGVESLGPVLTEQFSDMYAALLPKSDINPLTWSYQELADQAEARKDYASQLKWYRRALAIQPWHPYWMYAVGKGYLNVDDYTNAAAHFEMASAAARGMPMDVEFDEYGTHYDYPVEIRAQTFLAVCHRELGRFSQARTVLQEVIRRTPEYPRPYLELGRTASKRADHPQAIAYLESFLKLVPRHKEASELLETERRFLAPVATPPSSQ